MSGRISIIAVAVYALIAIGTFGHSAAQRDRINAAACETVNDRRSCLTLQPPSILVAPIAATLWPLYWSWEIAE